MDLAELNGFGFSKNVIVGVGAAVAAGRIALETRESFFQRVLNLPRGERVKWMRTFSWKKESDNTDISKADVVATMEFHRRYFQEHPHAFSLTEEGAYMASWPDIGRRCLNSENWHLLFQSPNSAIVDGIDGSSLVKEGLDGCGIWVMGMSGWAVFVAIPGTDTYKKDGEVSPFVSVAELGVGVVIWQPDVGWQKKIIPVPTDDSLRIAHGITIQQDARFRKLHTFLEASGGSEWIFSIGYAVGQEMVAGNLGLYIHGELAPHDYHPAHVFFSAMGVEHFTFIVDKGGNFAVTPPAFYPGHFNPSVRLGICGGHDKKRVLLIKQLIEGGHSGIYDLVNEFRRTKKEKPKSFFAAAGSRK
jgi:hypothetical protein